MKNQGVIVTVACGLSLLLTIASLAGTNDNARRIFTPGETPGCFNIDCVDEPLSNIVREACEISDLSIVTPSYNELQGHVWVRLINKPIIQTLQSIVQLQGWVLDDENGKGIYRMRRRRMEEERAASLRHFFDALRKEQFTEDQAMQILLRSMEEKKDKQ